MKALIFISTLITFFSCGLVKAENSFNKIAPIPEFEKSLKNIYLNIERYANKRDSLTSLDTTNSNSLVDKIYACNDTLTKLNKKLLSVMLAGDYSNIKWLKKTFDSIYYIKMICSNDSEFSLITWDTFLSDGEVPSYATIYVCRNGYINTGVFFLPNDITESNPFGGNYDLYYDTISQLNYKGKVGYFVVGHNQCGGLCQFKEAKIYQIANKKAVQLTDVFKVKNSTSSTLSFEYYLTADTQTVDFSLDTQNMSVSMPLFNKDSSSLNETKVIGEKIYTIDTNQFR